jgi:stearoyl-CoA desaturase (delta-9 desaturase)
MSRPAADAAAPTGIGQARRELLSEVGRDDDTSVTWRAQEAGMASRRDPDRVDWLASSPFIVIHLVALATPWLVPPTLGLAGVALAAYRVRMFGITAGYHRYFAHRAYRTGRVFQFILAFIGGTSAQKGALWWAAHHRDHHRNSDGPDDIHSPVQDGFWWSHVGWFLSTRHNATKLDRIKDLARFPELGLLDRYHAFPPALLALGLYLAGGWPALLWGFFVSTTLLWHGTFVINSLAHVMGRQRYQTGDESRNSFALAVITLGEGWHNNHHFYPTTANQGWFWWEVDASWAVLRMLRSVGLVSDLRTPPERIRLAHLAPAPRGSSAAHQATP